MGIAYDVVEYGFRVECIFILDTVCAAAVCAFTGKLTEAVIFMAVFSFLRVYTGGAHCRTVTGCCAAYTGIVFLGCHLAQKITILTEPSVLIPVIIYLLIRSPVQNENNLLSAEEIAEDAVTARRRIAAAVILYAVFRALNIPVYRLIGMVFISLGVLCVIQERKNRRMEL